MKRTLIELALVLSALAGMVAVSAFVDGTPAPKAIQIVGPSEAEIKEQVKSEHQAREYQRASRVAARVFRPYRQCGKYSVVVGRAAVDNGLSPSVLAALVYVESSCKPNADDGLGSVGLTQVNTKTWTRYSRHALLDAQTNVTVGAKVLAGYIHKFGVEEGLHHYNGFSDNHGHVYVKKVLEVASGKNIQAAN